MKLEDFLTLELAQADAVVIDKKRVGSGQFRGWAADNGVWLKLRVIQSDKANPLFSLADAVIITASDASSYFGIDPDLPDGVAVLQSLNVMHSAGIVTSAQRDEFLAISVTTTYPHANKTEHDFQIAKGTISRVSVGVNKGFCTITTTADCEKHRPQIYRRITFDAGDYKLVRVAGFGVVEKAGQYRVQCPSHVDMFIDNAYGVIN